MIIGLVALRVTPLVLFGVDMKIEIDFIPVEEKLPWEDWLNNFRVLFGDEEKALSLVDSTIDSFFVIVGCDDPNEDPGVIIADYTITEGWLYTNDLITQYNGDPWYITHWAHIPEIKKEKK